MKRLRILPHDAVAAAGENGHGAARGNGGPPRFVDALESAGLWPLRPRALDTLQVNVGYMCNQTCTHCHVEAGPHRKEVMTRDTMEACLRAFESGGFDTVDITGGAPEMNPELEWFLAALAERGASVIVRTNLTILVSGKAYRHFVELYRDLGVRLVASLPCYTAENTDGQRGDGAFRRSIEALRLLNSVGYGVPDGDLELVLVYNPGGPSLPPAAEALEGDYRRVLRGEHGVEFTRLIAMANLPVGRFEDQLREEGRLEAYVRTLADAFNPAAARGVMCRDLISVGWDGTIYDCDFNQMLRWPVRPEASVHIGDFDADALRRRRIVTGAHCFGCTAGAGSSCGGAIV